ncbi:MAG: hypothetical protein DRI90_28075 [Deltaproteobacteria bacterium]|nr:MAG: hypothetical protein DRI90_28075 [Deltaproteobacteria bacterium]
MATPPQTASTGTAGRGPAANSRGAATGTASTAATVATIPRGRPTSLIGEVTDPPQSVAANQSHQPEDRTELPEQLAPTLAAVVQLTDWVAWSHKGASIRDPLPGEDGLYAAGLAAGPAARPAAGSAAQG